MNNDLFNALIQRKSREKVCLMRSIHLLFPSRTSYSRSRMEILYLSVLKNIYFVGGHWTDPLIFAIAKRNANDFSDLIWITRGRANKHLTSRMMSEIEKSFAINNKKISQKDDQCLYFPQKCEDKLNAR
ncbi:hypothetical protein HN011_004116 [Eciton burchellii]|nr:hypothetical protein HN011_004116 [Eciton burchellii]